jgi:protein-tyrosine phosphatase
MDKNFFLGKVLPFLVKSVELGQPVVVHCDGGNGRTGHILAAWLVHGRNYEAKEALDMVIRMERDPIEAINHRHAIEKDLMDILTPVQEMPRDYNVGI